MNPPRGVQLGRYRLVKRLAGGGMAEVYLARMQGAAGFERDVVLKRIRPDLARSEEFVRMLLDEARIAATLHHSNIVQAFAVEEEGGEYFIAMEYLDGIDLRNVQAILDERDELMPLENALSICVGLASGLGHAHAKTDAEGRPLQIVHRDVSPHNVLLTRDGGVKLVDFGIAKSAIRETETLHGGLKGKLGYMSPEQVRGEELDHRSDLFALGIILYELTTGGYLFAGKNEYELVLALAEGSVERPSRIEPNYPAELERITMKALAKDREKRYASAGELQEDLEALARDVALTLSNRSLAKLVVEMAHEHASRDGGGETLTPWVANLAMKAGAEKLSLDEVLDSLEGDDDAADAPPNVASGKSQAELGHADTLDVLAEAAAIRSEGGGVMSAPNAAPTAQVVAVDPDPAAELRSGGRWLWIATLVLAAAAGVAGYLVTSGAEEELAPPPAPPPADPPAGKLEVAGGPDGAGVWLHLGETPAASPPLSTGSPHQLRIELEDHAHRDITVLPSRWAERGGEIGVWVSAELEPRRGESGRAAHRVPDPPARDTFEPTVTGDGVIHVGSDPEGADVWLLVGILPGVELGNVRADRAHRLRVARPGYRPHDTVVEPDDFELSDGGAGALVDVELERAR